ncbi:GNAT family N-acetyltransferase [Candidatus Pacearchaeota archaeon]|nr:GNAT family N-acetyltransferase [Candidatus Pacearchaeota archaeon]
MKIQRPCTKEKEQILEILKEDIGKEYLEDMVNEVDRVVEGKQDGLVLKEGKEILGYISWQRKIKTIYLETIAVKKEFQRKGYGRILVSSFLEHATRKNPDIEVLNVITDADAKKAISFYQSCGFQVSGSVNNEFIPDTPQVHLSLKINKQK